MRVRSLLKYAAPGKSGETESVERTTPSWLRREKGEEGESL